MCAFYSIEDLNVQTGCLVSRRICMCLLLSFHKSTRRNHNTFFFAFEMSEYSFIIVPSVQEILHVHFISSRSPF